MIKNLFYTPAAFESLYDELGSEAFKYCDSKYILTNVFYWWKKKEEDISAFRELCRTYDKTSLVDSGGFQLITGSVKINKFDPKRIFVLQSQTADIGFILDFPLVKTEKDEDGKKSMFIITKNSEVEDRIRITRENIDAIRSLDKKAMKYYFVVHGGLIEHYDKWISSLYEKDFFDGITLKTKNLYQLFCSFFASYHLGFSRYHALGTSSLSMVVTLAYLLKKCEDYGRKIHVLTYDSTSPLQYAIYKRALLQFAYATKSFKIHVTNCGLKSLGCDCEVCNYLGDKSIETYAKSQSWLVLHNISLTSRFNKFISSLVADKKVFSEFIQLYYPRLTKFLKVVDLVFEEVMAGKEFCRIYNELDIGIRHYVESLVDLEEDLVQHSWEKFL